LTPQRQGIQLSQTLTSSPEDHALATPPGQQVAQQLPSPHTEQEAPPKDKEAPQLPSPPSKIEAPKEKETSPVLGMPPPSSSPYDTIHEDLALYKMEPHSDPTDQFFAAMKNLKSPPRTSSAMSAPAQHAKMYMRACKIESH
jgi:hypothetical protein